MQKALRNFEKSSNMPKCWQKMKKIIVQLVLYPYFLSDSGYPTTRSVTSTHTHTHYIGDELVAVSRDLGMDGDSKNVEVEEGKKGNPWSRFICVYKGNLYFKGLLFYRTVRGVPL